MMFIVDVTILRVKHILNSDVSGFVSNTASVVTHGQVDIALNTPVSVPRVTHNPVRRRSGGVVANQLHAMVKQVDLIRLNKNLINYRPIRRLLYRVSVPKHILPKSLHRFDSLAS